MNNTIKVAFCATRNLYEHLAVTITSLLKHNPNVLIYLLIEDDEYNYFQSDVHINVINVNKLNLEIESTNPNTDKYYTYMSLVRNYLPLILKNVNKIISMDVDIIVNGSLEEIWNWDLRDNYIAAVPEYHKVQPEEYKYYGYEFNKPYVNVGFTIMNLELMRQHHIVDQTVSLMNVVPLKWADQDALNMTCKNHIMLLPHKYNSTIFTGVADFPVIIHGTPVKPWADKEDNYIKPIYDYFKEVYKNEYIPTNLLEDKRGQ